MIIRPPIVIIAICMYTWWENPYPIWNIDSLNWLWSWSIRNWWDGKCDARGSVLSIELKWSQSWWKQNFNMRGIVDVVLTTMWCAMLPSSSVVIVMLYCWILWPGHRNGADHNNIKWVSFLEIEGLGDTGEPARINNITANLHALWIQNHKHYGT